MLLGAERRTEYGMIAVDGSGLIGYVRLRHELEINAFNYAIVDFTKLA